MPVLSTSSATMYRSKKQGATPVFLTATFSVLVVVAAPFMVSSSAFLIVKLYPMTLTMESASALFSL